MRHLTAVTSVLVLFVLASPSLCADSEDVALPPGSRLTEHVVGLPGLDNVGRIEDGLYRGAQPEDPEGYEALRRMGIRTVLNLRARHSERVDVEAHGMKSLEIPLSMLESPDRESVERAVQAMATPELRPLYVHCALGEDRTGVVVAVYRMNESGWSLKEAEAEMQDFGFNDMWVYLKSFLRDYAEEPDD
jgi:protein tyrosine/serine phosphatase